MRCDGGCSGEESALGSAVPVDGELSAAPMPLPELRFVLLAAVVAFWLILINSANACSDEVAVLAGGAYGFRT